MLYSLSLILILSLAATYICKKIKIPPLFGMLLIGMILGPYALNQIDVSILNISSQLRKIALVIILLRAGFNLDINDLKKVGRPAILMSFVPALFEIGAYVVIAPLILGISYSEAFLLGCVIAAVSPAVIVPSMLKIMEEKYGDNKKIPQLILAGASVDDVVVIILFYSALALESSHKYLSFKTLLTIPLSIVIAILIGIIIGLFLNLFFKKIKMRDSVKVIIILAIAFFVVSMEKTVNKIIPFAALLSVMSFAMTIFSKSEKLANRLSKKLSKLWIFFEILLFVLVGATVQLTYLKETFFIALLMICIALAIRMIAVQLSLIKTNLNFKERLFCTIAYIPKATVQAAIGAVALTMGLGCGSIILSLAVVSILFTAVVGAFLIEHTYKKLLFKEKVVVSLNENKDNN